MTNKSLPHPFPPIVSEVRNNDFNPAIRLYGKRFIKEQTEVEFVSEFLSVLFSDKWLSGEKVEGLMPSLERIKSWSQEESKLQYRPPVRINLKLLSLLGSSRVDSRHWVHQEQYRKLYNNMVSKIQVTSGDPEEVIEWIEKLFRGYKGAAFNRTWCAQTFYPISESLITQETIWNETVVKKETPKSWLESIQKFKKYYSVSKHRFMARGGELLYLQLCNVFAAEAEKIKSFASKIGIVNQEEGDEVLSTLYSSLQEGLEKFRGINTEALDKLVQFIEDLDPETKELTNKETERLSCEWCPQDSWPEGFLFAVEIDRLLKAALDPVERLELFMTGCVLQVMRSLCTQSARYSSDYSINQGSTLGYSWLFTPSDIPTRQQRLASQGNLQAVLALIQQALRTEELQENANRASQSKTLESYLKEADNKYGYKLFLSLGKRLGIIAPYTGPGARFVMTDNLLRYMVLTLIPPGKSCTYKDFLIRLNNHYGIAIEGEILKDAVKWSGLPPNNSILSSRSDWLTQMLRAGGFLTELSDDISIVHNDFVESRISSREV